MQARRQRVGVISAKLAQALAAARELGVGLDLVAFGQELVQQGDLGWDRRRPSSVSSARANR